MGLRVSKIAARVKYFHGDLHRRRYYYYNICHGQMINSLNIYIYGRIYNISIYIQVRRTRVSRHPTHPTLNVIYTELFDRRKYGFGSLLYVCRYQYYYFFYYKYKDFSRINEYKLIPGTNSSTRIIIQSIWCKEICVISIYYYYYILMYILH